MLVRRSANLAARCLEPLRRLASGDGKVSRVSRDGAALMLSTGTAAACSLLFWVVAARIYPTQVVGAAAGAISALTMLAGFAQLSLQTVFLRFLVSAGKKVLLLLSIGYSASAFASVTVGILFLVAGFGSGFLGERWWEHVAFVLAVPVLATFVVQDVVLTAFGKAPWAPAENLAVAIARLGLLGVIIPVLLNGQDPGPLGIIVAWTVPALCAVVAVSVAIFGRLAPSAARRAATESLLPTRRELTSFVSAEYTHNLIGNVISYAPALLLLHLRGADAAAYFNVPWLIIMVTQTLLWNIGASFIAESTREPDLIASHTRHTLRLGGGLVVTWTVALLIGAPFFLQLQGDDFAAQGTGLLRLLALSIPCAAVVVMYSLVATLERRIWQLAAVNGVAATVLISAVVGIPDTAPLWSVGLVYLLVQVGLAAVLLPVLVVRLRKRQIRLPELGADEVSSGRPG